MSEKNIVITISREAYCGGDELAKKLAEKYGLAFVGLQDKLDEASKDGDTEYWLADGVHPTAAGHCLIKDELMKAFNE